MHTYIYTYIRIFAHDKAVCFNNKAALSDNCDYAGTFTAPPFEVESNDPL